jgi:hypothetical protein
MISSEYLLVSQLCNHYQVDPSFFMNLQDNGWVETMIVEDAIFVHQDALPKIEKIIRLQNHLELNSEGIDVVLNLLDKVETMYHEIQVLKNRLKRYE